jgi:hypothetical protein
VSISDEFTRVTKRGKVIIVLFTYNTTHAICRALLKHDYRREDVFTCYNVLMLKLAYSISLRLSVSGCC